MRFTSTCTRHTRVSRYPSPLPFSSYVPWVWCCAHLSQKTFAFFGCMFLTTRYYSPTHSIVKTEDCTGWKNSVRHNLSIHQQFKRISAADSVRNQHAKGVMRKTKGAAGLWTINHAVCPPHSALDRSAAMFDQHPRFFFLSCVQHRQPTVSACAQNFELTLCVG